MAASMRHFYSDGIQMMRSLNFLTIQVSKSEKSHRWLASVVDVRFEHLTPTNSPGLGVVPSLLLTFIGIKKTGKIKPNIFAQQSETPLKKF